MIEIHGFTLGGKKSKYTKRTHYCNKVYATKKKTKDVNCAKMSTDQESVEVDEIKKKTRLG